jgi:hypothetical protein
MSENLDTKVVVKQTFLTGSQRSDLCQRVATVYIDGKEFRVYAPPEAKGNALEWREHFSVTDGHEYPMQNNALGILALKAATEELTKQKRDSNRGVGMNPDGIHCDAQICLNGHILHWHGTTFDSKTHCTKCGAACIDECTHCREPIHGAEKFTRVDAYSRPQFCHGCGRPYPWMEDQIKTARELLSYDEKLTAEDRLAVLENLKYVVSDPTNTLAAAKRKLIEIKLENATDWVRVAITDLVAKTIAEIVKG